jgi:hypothetical protein
VVILQTRSVVIINDIITKIKRMKNLLWILLTIISISLHAQPNEHSPMDSLLKKFGQEKLNTGLPNLMDVDSRIIHSMPTIPDYKNINARINELPNDYIRLLDSVDYFMIGKDTLIVKVYTQNYAYQSRNSYKLGVKKQSNNDSLRLYNIFYDMKMKAIIEDYPNFMNRQFEYKIFVKEIDDIKTTKRIIITKNYR